MQTKYLNIALILGLFILFSCIEEYSPDVSKYEEVIVIDGTLTDAPGPYTVKISYSAKIGDPNFNPVPECRVYFEDDLGNLEQLYETEAGTYKTSNESFRGIPGRSYKIIVNSPEGKTYESDYITLKEKLGIDTVTAVIETHPNPDLDHDEIGYQFYVTTNKAKNDSLFLSWRLTYTYEYHSDLTIDYYWYGRFVKNPNPDTLYTCYLTEKLRKIFTVKQLVPGEQRIANFPLNYVNTEDKKISVRYSLMIEQYNITKECQNYLEEINKQTEGENSLYNNQPYQIRGNVSNINDPDEVVLGYFTVAGYDSLRIFVDRPMVKFYKPVCGYDTDIRGFVYTWSWMWPIYAYLTPDGSYAHSSKSCFDCTKHLGKLEKPGFWIDNYEN